MPIVNPYWLITTLASIPAIAGSPTSPRVTLDPIGSFRSGGVGAAEIGAYHPATRRVYFTNAERNAIGILDVSDPASPVAIRWIDLAPYGGGVNSVAVSERLIAAAVEGVVKQDPGRVVVFDLEGALVSLVEVGALPDMLTFTPDGRRIVVANEGEPSEDYSVDPEGSVSVIDLPEDPRRLGQRHVRTADFRRFNTEPIDPTIRVFGPGASAAQDLEPEYIAISDDGTTAWVTLQENNAIAVIDLDTARVTALLPLGHKDHSRHALDASNRDGGIRVRPAPVFGMYQPDTIRSITIDGTTYLLCADEGDPRGYRAFDERVRVKDLTLDPTVFPDAEELQKDEYLGRLRVTRTLGDTDGDGDFDALYAFGGRGFSIRDTDGRLVFDSGPQFELITALQNPETFNTDDSPEAGFESRSPERGPEPEAIAAGRIGDRTYAFIGMERTSSIVVYDITEPSKSEPVGYASRRRSAGQFSPSDPGDAAPESIVFVPASDSPNGEPMLITCNEWSGTVSFWRVSVEPR
ncbi:MAG: alkaline phosphatase [Planctomycetota bacterium]|nr:MAG: alkaline phosphatase [Planctomycetota bacterium]